MLAGMGGVVAPNPRYRGAPIGWPGSPVPRGPGSGDSGPLRRGRG